MTRLDGEFRGKEKINKNMALVTIQRSPSLTTAEENDEIDGAETQEEQDTEALDNRHPSINECYFTVKGAALVLPQNECMHVYRKNTSQNGVFREKFVPRWRCLSAKYVVSCAVSAAGLQRNVNSTSGWLGTGDIQQHLQSMFYLLRPEDTLKMAVKLESVHMGRTRYLVVVSCIGRQSTEESCLLGIDCNEKATTGLVLPVWADTQITLDGDGGFSVSSSGRHHIFKPVSVQAMWSALQTLHKAGAKARLYNCYMGGLTHSWIDYYELRIESERSCLNEWHAMDDLESRRPLSPDSLRCRPERDATERYIRGKLKEIMMSVDLDEVTSKYIRSRLEEDMNTDLHEYKSFIDQEMIIILGQMDAATEIFEYLYLGSEWNASNLEELQRNGVGHILNVTREIDNFFPGMFDYLNIRVYDEEGTELLKHWDKTFKFIEKAKRNGSKVLVHCKMGVSRSASVVIAYAMKAYDWNMQHALEFVKTKRTCIKPNGGFLKQLETYQGILDASKQRHNTLWRSKSETNLKSPLQDHHEQDSPPSPLPHDPYPYLDVPSTSHRPKSWSPEDHIVNMLFPEKRLITENEPDSCHPARLDAGVDPSTKVLLQAKNKHMLLPGRNGQSYSVSQNKALHLPIRLSTASSEEKVTFCIGDGDDSPVYECRNPLYASDQSDVLTQVLPLARVSSVKDRINELETQAQLSDLRSARDRLDLPELKGLVLNLANQFESVSKPNTPSPIEELNGEAELRAATTSNSSPELRGVEYPVVSQTKAPPTRHQAVLVRPETWVDEEKNGWVLNGWQKQDTKGEAVELVKQQDQLLMKLRITSQNSPLDISTKNDESDNSNVWPVCPKALHQISSGSSSQLTSPVASVDEAYFAVTDVRSAAHEGPHRESSLSSGCEIKTPPVLGRKDDPFSVDLDRVFEREERKQRSNLEGMTQAPSRQDSFGSCDSAIVLQSYGTRESPSRQSSWSSVDSHQTYLSRESSLGYGDCRHSSSVNGHAFTSCSTLRKPSTVSAPDSQYSSPGADLHTSPFAIDTTTVKRAKPKIDDSSRQGSLKRTNSFDSSLITQELSPLSPKSPNPPNVSPVQRSHSLRTGDRTTEGRHQLPNMKLHTAKPYRSPVDKEAPATLVTKASTSPPPVLHTVSFPTLVEGVPVGCMDTRPIDIVPQSSVGRCPFPLVPNSRSALKLDFGALINQPASPPSTEEPPISPSNNDETGVMPGTVQQKKQALEHRLATTPAKPVPPQVEDAASKEHLQHIRDLGRVVCQLPSPEIDDATLGKVKRLTKELESKSGQLPPRRSRLVILDQQGKEVEDTSEAKASTGSVAELSSPLNVSNSTANLDSPCIEEGEKSVRLLVGKFEMKDTHRTRYHSENDADPRISTDNECSSNARSSSGSPPLPNPSARKFSFDLDKSKCGGDTWRGGPSATPAQLPDQSSSHPSSPSHNILSSSSPAVCVVMPHTRHLPSSAPKGDTSSMPPAPPIGGAPRKMRKLHGKSHPLTKLPQRHPNPVYNTM